MGDLIYKESETSSDSYLFFIHIIMYTKMIVCIQTILIHCAFLHLDLLKGEIFV